MVAVEALNDILDEGMELHPLEEQRNSVRDWRQIGLGIMGLADALIKMEITYGSDEAIEFCDSLAKFMADEALFASAALARDHGPYPKYNTQAIVTPFFNAHASGRTREWVAAYGLRNSQLLTIAPTGTLSTMLGISGGIEPIFANSYTRKTESLHGGDVYYKVYTPIVDKYMKSHGLTEEEELPEWFVTSANISPVNRVRMQGAWQNGIDASISSTVNLPHSATVEDVQEIYMEAWRYGLKGITVFRDGCQRTGILTTSNKEEDQPTEAPALKRGDIVECSEDLIGFKRKLTTGCVDCDTEFFNGTEWKKISEYQKGDLVLQYNMDGSAELVAPLDYIKRPSEGMYHFKTKYGLDMMVSRDHRNVTFNTNPNKPKIMTTDEIMAAHTGSKSGFARSFKKSFVFNGHGIDLTDDEIRISIAVFADGCFYSPTSKKCLIAVTKNRKRDRLINLLESAGIEYSENIAADGYYEIKFYPPIEGKQKTFPEEWYQCSQHQLQVVFDEVFNWDGFAAKKNQYTTIHKCNADFVQFVCSAIGKASAIHVDNRRREIGHHICYRVDWSNRVLRSIVERPKREIPFVQPRDGYDYCFSVPSTMLVLRRNNEIFITGNCGSLHVMGFFDPVNGEMQEVYLAKGSTGGCANFMTGLSRMISLLCRAGVSVYDIKDQLDSTGACPSYAARTATKHDTSKGSCCPMAIGNALISMYEEMQEQLDDSWETREEKCADKHEENTQKGENSLTGPKCPECGEPLVAEGGCFTCRNCPYTKCS